MRIVTNICIITIDLLFQINSQHRQKLNFNVTYDNHISVFIFRFEKFLEFTSI